MAQSEQSLIQQACGIYRGPLKSWAYLVTLFGLVFTAAFLYSGWRFWIAESINDHFHWGVALLLSALFIALMKIWFWLQMAKNEIIRRIEGK